MKSLKGKREGLEGGTVDPVRSCLQLKGMGEVQMAQKRTRREERAKVINVFIFLSVRTRIETCESCRGVGKSLSNAG